MKGEMPSTIVINPKCLKSLTLRSGKELEGPKDPRLEQPEEEYQPIQEEEVEEEGPLLEEGRGEPPDKGKETIDVEKLPFHKSYQTKKKKQQDESQLKECMETYGKV